VPLSWCGLPIFLMFSANPVSDSPFCDSFRHATSRFRSYECVQSLFLLAGQQFRFLQSPYVLGPIPVARCYVQPVSQGTVCSPRLVWN
jgi:hypothetical protein